MNNQEIILPLKIKAGSKFGFFSPSDPIYPRRVEFIQNAIKIINDWGFETEIISEKLFNDWAVLRTPEKRAEEFHNKLKSSEFDGLIAAWGGKNTSDLLNLLDYKLIQEIKKPIIGSSDIGVMLNAITQQTGLVTYYGPNVLGKLNQTKEIGFPLLMENNINGRDLFPTECLNEIKILRDGSCKGCLIGGSLGTFTLGLSGTNFIPKYAKTVFFFESSSLDYFRIRQHLQNMKNTKFLENVVAMIIGATNQINDDVIEEFENMILDFLPSTVPIIKTDSFGHGFYFNPTFPIGMNIVIDTSNRIFKIEL